MTNNLPDLLSLVSGDTTLTRVASTKGGEYAGPCPFCGGSDRLRVWPNHPSGRPQWWCRGCGKGGDVIAYLAQRGDLTPAEAGRLRRGGAWPGDTSTPAAPRPPTPKHAEVLAPPGPEWQRAARAFVADCQAALWADIGRRALAWLRGRGLADETIRAAGLGYNPKDARHERQTWGLPKGRPIWLPRGIVIPWEVDGSLWRVNIRRPQGKPKYFSPAGLRNALYNADALRPDTTP